MVSNAKTALARRAREAPAKMAASDPLARRSRGYDLDSLLMRKPDLVDEGSVHRLADELDYVSRMIEQMGNALSADPTVIARHVVTLQAVDVVGQMLAQSDNATAELILKEIGLQEGGVGTTDAGAAAGDENALLGKADFELAHWIPALVVIGVQILRSAFFQYCWRRSFFSTLPTGLRGSMSMKSTVFGAITLPSLALHSAMISSAVTW